jgi:uncharacterized protein YjbI with pentapeptide repeats
MWRFLSGLADWSRRLFAVPNARGTLDPETLTDPVNDAAKEIGTHSLTLMVTAAYIAVSAARVTDPSFLFGDEISLPVVNVGIPVHSFFLVAPALLLVQHMALLLQQYFLLKKMALAKNWPPKEAARLHPSLSVSRHSPEEEWAPVRLLVRLVYAIVYFVVPLAVLVYLQACSVRYHDPSTRFWIGISAAVDVIGAAGLILVSTYIKQNSPAFTVASRAKGLYRVFGFPVRVVLVSLTVIVFSVFYSDLARFTDREACKDDNERVFGFLNVRRHLILNQQAFSTRAAAAKQEPISFRNLELACANFSGAHLEGADFRGAELQNANFQGAHLQGALFSNRNLETAAHPAHLAGTKFGGADLTQAQLARVDLRNADLRSAFLQEANLSDADLSGVKAIKADLLGANLSRAFLRGADFRDARLTFADLSDAHLEFAQFWRAQLDDVSFSRAVAVGADFRQASLRGARDLELRAVNLHAANLWHLDSCGLDRGVIYLADLRSVKLDAAGWETEREALLKKARTPISASRWKELTRRESDQTCITLVTFPKTSPSGDPLLLEKAYSQQLVLYDGAVPETPFADWPERSALTEEAFYRRLASFLIEQACLEKSNPAERQRFSVGLSTLVIRHIGQEEILSDFLGQEKRNASCLLEDQPPSATLRRP